MATQNGIGRKLIVLAMVADVDYGSDKLNCELAVDMFCILCIIIHYSQLYINNRHLFTTYFCQYNICGQAFIY